MKSVVIIQARTSSSRLPAKILLPIGGYPLVVLVAKRAANTGKKVIVVTSDNKSDDALEKTLNKYKIDCFRGSLNNTLSRFVKALKGFSDETIIFRLTADNPFPDGKLLEEIEADFLKNNYNYLCCNGEKSGLPYGMSVEITYLKHLREAFLKNESVLDQEHVTPYIRRRFGEIYFDKYIDLKKGLYRCTIDMLDDYLQVQQVFSRATEPVNICALKLVDYLSELGFQPVAKHSVCKLIIGGAQLGLKYGIANTKGQPSENESVSILKTAINNGVQYIDTARAYGDSEKVIGKALLQGWDSRVNIITKLSPLTDCYPDEDRKTVFTYVDASIFQSTTYLKQSLDVLMLHRATHIYNWNGYVWERLLQLKKQGIIRSLGVSIQSPQELEQVMKNDQIEFIQMPFNILDDRWGAMLGTIEKIKKKRRLVIHVRSSLLQGLLCSDKLEHWNKANIDNGKQIQEWLSTLAEEYQRSNIVDLCLAYVRSQQWVDGVVVGMETQLQLIENIKYFDTLPLNQKALQRIELQRPKLYEKSLNPSLWKTG